MVKKMIAASVSAFMLIFCCGCEAVNSAVSDLFRDKGKITLGQYMGIEIDPAEYEKTVTDDDVDRYIHELLIKDYSGEEVTDRPAAQGDTVNIDFCGTMNGETFEGGSAEGYEAVIGSEAMIEGFDSGLVGASKGDNFTLELTFPDNYHVAEFAGKPVIFEVTVNGIYDNSVPALTDDFVKDNMGAAGVEEYQSTVKAQLEATADSQNMEARKAVVWSAVMSGCTFERYPQDQIDAYSQRMIDKHTEQAAAYNMSLDDYIAQRFGLSPEEFAEQVEALAKDQVGEDMVVSAIAKKEGISLSKSEYAERLSEYLAEHGYESADTFKTDYGKSVEEYFGKDILEKYFLYVDVVGLVSDNAVEIEK